MTQTLKISDLLFDIEELVPLGFQLVAPPYGVLSSTSAETTLSSWPLMLH